MALAGRKVDDAARRRFAEDQQTAERLPDLVRAVAEAEEALERAQREDADYAELHRLGVALDSALTDAMRAAYAQERVLIGPRGYVDRIYRRKRLATPKVRHATETAERLLTAREHHRLHGIERLPRNPAAV
ncbi:hypothetical protein LG943_26935 [Streptomonospora sp. S1-112]|uniref:Uncharacterized protein n=1 Tax=Streptomonospora mangrovi TaxID=2883123 RepID=A0A9X3SK01_9ACTN|nr:hypothetical protein [Streptomonospora mangrovi]MDA0567929.1 hypothetical protein [Streptomonospora mangrovi]